MNKYVPKSLSRRDKKKQLRMLNLSRKMYKKGKFYTRNKINSFTSKKSKHILKAMRIYSLDKITPSKELSKAMRIYSLDKITPSKELSKASGCPMKVLEGIVNKGEGAYYSSGSRPNQTAQSWAYARLASALTGGPSSVVDYHLVSQCNPKKNAYKMAKNKMNPSS